MKQQPEHDYLECMRELAERLEGIAARLDAVRQGGPTFQDYELISLSFRKCVELIVFSSLVAHKGTYSKAHSDFESHWNAKRLMANLKKIHPDFYPVPIQFKEHSGVGEVGFDLIEDRFLTQNDAVDLYNDSAVALHVTNPFRLSSELPCRRSFTEWYNLIVGLMALHQIRLIDRPEYWIVRLASPEIPRPHLLVAVKARE
jgi:hypothetical protein